MNVSPGFPVPAFSSPLAVISANIPAVGSLQVAHAITAVVSSENSHVGIISTGRGPGSNLFVILPDQVSEVADNVVVNVLGAVVVPFAAVIRTLSVPALHCIHFSVCIGTGTSKKRSRFISAVGETETSAFTSAATEESS